MVKLSIPDKYRAAFDILSRRLNILDADIVINLVECDEMSVSFDGHNAVIRCNAVNRFARLLGILAQKYKYGPFEVSESIAFDTLSCMLDVSFGTPLTVDSVKEYLEYMALFGFNQLQFYMEDMYTIEGYPYFGYMRGRYTYDELKEIDDYAYSLGIEAVPCIETLGHMAKYLRWSEASAIKDTAGVFLADSDKTYDFISKMIDASSSPFRTDKIHIGCDETYGLGTGNYIKRGGTKKPIDLFLDHVAKVCDICREKNLKPMMWSDMLCSSFSKSGGNWSADIEIPEYVAQKLPENLKLVFWHYGQIQGAEKYMIPKHRAIGKDPIFAGASQVWQTNLPDLYFSIIANESSLTECKKLGTREVMITVWNYAHTIYQTSLLDLCQYGELTYGDGKNLRERFEFLTEASYDAFMQMSNLGHMYKTDYDKTLYKFGRCEDGDAFVKTDILLNVKYNEWEKESRTEFYNQSAQYFDTLKNREGKWKFLYEYSYCVLHMMYKKSMIVESLTNAYRNNDKETLATIANKYIPEYIDALDELSEVHAYHRDTYLKPFGAEATDALYGKHKERARTAKRRILNYLNGKTDKIDELEEKVLNYQWGIFL